MCVCVYVSSRKYFELRTYFVMLFGDIGGGSNGGNDGGDDGYGEAIRFDAMLCTLA